MAFKERRLKQLQAMFPQSKSNEHNVTMVVNMNSKSSKQSLFETKYKESLKHSILSKSKSFVQSGNKNFRVVAKKKILKAKKLKSGVLNAMDPVIKLRTPEINSSKKSILNTHSTYTTTPSTAMKQYVFNEGSYSSMSKAKNNLYNKKCLPYKSRNRIQSHRTKSSW